MSPVLIAALEVACLVVVFWTTRAISSSGKKWFLRVIAFFVVVTLGGTLLDDVKAASVSGEYLTYFGIPTAIVYSLVAKRSRPKPSPPRGRRRAP